MRGREQVVACFFGDIAIAVGKFHERIRPAALWNYLCTSSAKIATP
jgi:TPP-dependent pyruvate/acetoin dehydrogenase alpha subunit